MMSKRPRRILLLTFSSSRFIGSARLLCKRAIELDFTFVRIFSPLDLTSNFVQENAETLIHQRGAGYWIWKPWIILDTLKILDGDEGFLYLDAGALPNLHVDSYLNFLTDGKIHLWSQKSALEDNKYWVDPDVWEHIVGDRDVRGTHAWAGAILSPNTEECRRIIEMWLNLCLNPKLLRPETFQSYTRGSELIAHRHDQSILNCLIFKYPDLFRVHALNESIHNGEFISHRFKKVHTRLEVILLLKLQAMYRHIMSFLPQKLESAIRHKVTQIRKPEILKEELISLDKLHRRFPKS